MINLTFETFDEMVAFAGQILGTQTGKAVAQNTAPVTEATTVAPAQAPVTPQAPTQMPTYSIDQIAVGAIQLKDAGRLGEFQQLLARFGVAALTQLQPAQLPEIAAELQKMGVKL
nr:MAG TPA: hypothetical protein [Caudoviricetes sp.]